MHDLIFFLPTGVFLMMAIIFPLAISNAEKLPSILCLNIGSLNIDDIRKLNNRNCDYLRNQVLFHFAMAAVATFLISNLFVIFGNANNGVLILMCNLIGTFVGLVFVFNLAKKVNTLKVTDNKQNESHPRWQE